nr:MAG TPA: hypothetical protein [Caudoviricetes sp.]
MLYLFDRTKENSRSYGHFHNKYGHFHNKYVYFHNKYGYFHNPITVTFIICLFFKLPMWINRNVFE